MSTPSLVLSSVALVLSILAVAGLAVAVVLVQGLVRSAETRLLGSLRAAMPDAEKTLRDLRSVEGRTRALMKKAGTAQPDDDDLIHALGHPVARGIAKAAGIDVDKLKGGDEKELQKAMKLVEGKQESEAGTDRYL